ncbi:chemotaxis-specific protein-glutamate methyltransferase CheB [Pelosinus sp. sgz500959]|uniref:chemotaxis-specific protein-glutamate methyltransferase CheB n=1 Tax=Pelosinus sp. sgz500959 TaxID=3242472 RepID=UPI00366BBF69
MSSEKNSVRVLVVEDSPLVSEIMIGILSSDPRIKVIGTAMNGVEGIRLAKVLRPDLITMDIEMPVMGGLDAIEVIMRECPTPILVVTSRSDARLAYEAISRGALEVIEKPVFDEVDCSQFIRKIKILARVQVIRHITGKTSIGQGMMSERGKTINSAHGRKIVAIASSLGGPKVLEKIFSRLTADFPLPIVVAQHITAGFAVGFADWLNQKTSLKVQIAFSGAVPKSGEVLIAPPEYNMFLTKTGIIELLPILSHQIYHPSCDTLLCSAAEIYDRAAIGIILTGMGDDGVKGIQKIKAAGGMTIAQDKESCAVYNMPRLVAENGTADYILAAEHIAEKLIRVAR